MGQQENKGQGRGTGSAKNKSPGSRTLHGKTQFQFFPEAESGDTHLKQPLPDRKKSRVLVAPTQLLFLQGPSSTSAERHQQRENRETGQE